MTFHRECGQGSTTADADDNINKRKGRSAVRVSHGTFGITPVTNTKGLADFCFWKIFLPVRWS